MTWLLLNLPPILLYKLLIKLIFYYGYNVLNEIDIEISNEEPRDVKTPRVKGSKYALEISNLYAGGLITINLIFLQQLFSSGASSPGALIGEVAFTMALPALTGILVANTIQSWYPYKPYNSIGEKLLQIVFLIGIGASIVGISGVFWSVSELVAIAFFVSLLFTSFVVLLYVSALSHKP